MDEISRAELGARIVQISNGVGRAFVNDPTGRELVEKGRPIDILVVASDLRDRDKVPSRLLDALTAASGTRVALVGENPPKNLPQHMQALGAISNPSDLARVYAQSKTLLQLSTKETFGLVAAEALCQGCYVVGLGESATPEILSSVGGRPADSIETAIDIALRAGALELFMGKSRREIAARAQEAFSPTAMTKAYYDLYRDVLGK